MEIVELINKAANVEDIYRSCEGPSVQLVSDIYHELYFKILDPRINVRGALEPNDNLRF